MWELRFGQAISFFIPLTMDSEVLKIGSRKVELNKAKGDPNKSKWKLEELFSSPARLIFRFAAIQADLSKRPEKDPVEDEAGEIVGDRWFYEDRWLYNWIVFLLLLPFTIVVSIGFPPALSIGVALTVWRIAATPEIMNLLSFGMSVRLRRFSRYLAIGFVSGFILLNLSYYESAGFLFRTGSRGFPLSYVQPVSDCYGPGLAVGCGIVYNPLNIILDYLIWSGLSLAIVALVGWAVTRRKRHAGLL